MLHNFILILKAIPRTNSVKLAIEEMKFFCKEINILGVYKASDFRKKNRKKITLSISF